MEHEILQNIDRGYDFFCAWLDTITTKGKPSIITLGLILHDKYVLCVLGGGGAWRLAYMQEKMYSYMCTCGS